MQPQQIQANRLECRDGIRQPLLHRAPLRGEIGDDPIVPLSDRGIGGIAFDVGERVLQLVEPAAHALGVTLEAVHDIGQIAQLTSRFAGEAFVELLGCHADGELGGSVRSARGNGVFAAEPARLAKDPAAEPALPELVPEFSPHVGAPPRAHDRDDSRDAPDREQDPAQGRQKA